MSAPTPPNEPTLPPNAGEALPWALTTGYPPSAASANEALAPTPVAVIPEAMTTSFAAVPGYEILAELGRGGMGVVYKARQIALDRLVALKMILHADHAAADDRARFKIEAEAVARLQHPNIVQVFEVGEADGLPYFSLEFCPGGSLDGKLNGTPLPALDAARLMETLARAVEAAHRAHVIHRDLKPANVLLTAEGEPKISDFGLAKKLDVQGQTQSGAVMGTPSYMAPEQAGGQKEIGPAADVYALGAILYELLTGRPPFRAATALDTIMQVVSEEPVPPRRLQSKVPRDLETICLKCLQKQPACRYASAAALADDLRRFRAGEPIEARPVGRWDRGWRWCRRNPMVASLSAALLVLLIAVAVGSTVAAIHLNEKESEARHNADVADEAKGQAEQERERMRNLLSQQYVAKGNQLVDDGDLLGSLPWFTEALLLDRDDPEREHLHRVRLGTVLRQCPRLAQIWHHEEEIKDAQVSPDGRLLVVATGDWHEQNARGHVQVWDVGTGKAHGPPLEQAGIYEHVSFSPDGRHIVTVRADNTVRVWDVASGRPVTPPLRPNSYVAKALFRLDGRRLITAGYGSEVQIWDVDGGRLLASRQFGGALLALSPDGQRIVVGSGNKNVRLCDIASGREIASFQFPHSGEATFSPDGRWLALSGSNFTAQVWDAQTGQPVTPILDPRSQIHQLVFSPDSRLLVMCGAHAAFVWEVRTARQVLPALSHEMWVLTASFSRDGRYLVTAGLDQTARVWDVESGQPVTGSLRHGRTIQHAFFADDSSRLIVAADDGTVRLWNLSARRSAQPLLPHDKPVEALSIRPDGRHVLTASDKALQLWDIKTGKPSGAPMRHDLPIRAAVPSPDGQRVLAIYADPGTNQDKAYLWDIPSRKGKELPMEWKGYRIPKPSFSRDGRKVLLFEDTGYFKIWDTTTGELLARVPHSQEKHSGFFLGAAGFHLAALSPDGDRIVAYGRFAMNVAPEVFLWDEQARESRKIPAKAGVFVYLAFSPDGRAVLTATHNNEHNARLWDVESGQPLLPPLDHHGGAVPHAAFSPDGRRIATASADLRACIWDAATGKQLAELKHSGAVWRAWFNADGRRLITTSNTGNGYEWEARVWDAQTGEALTPPLHHSWAPNKWIDWPDPMAAFSPDDHTLATAYRDGSVGLWDLSPDKRPAEDLRLLAQMLTQQKNRAGQDPEVLRNAEVHAAWEQLRAKYLESFASSSVDDYEWHRHGAETCERRAFAEDAVRHLHFLLQAHPGDKALHIRSANLGNKAAQASFDQKDYPKARRLVEEAAQHARSALTAAPKEAGYRATLAANRRLAASILIALGNHASVPTCVAEFLEMGANPADTAYDCGCYLSRCVPLAENDGNLPETKRKELAQQYAQRAVALLRQAFDKGWNNAEWIKQDRDLDPLRERADFEQCITELNTKVAPKK
jgi:WD40 repeat protein